MSEWVRLGGTIVGYTFGDHPDTGGETHMVPVVHLPEGAIVGDAPDPAAAHAEAMAAAQARIAELESERGAQLAAAQARIAELEAGNAAAASGSAPPASDAGSSAGGDGPVAVGVGPHAAAPPAPPGGSPE